MYTEIVLERYLKQYTILKLYISNYHERLFFKIKVLIF